MNTLIAVGIVAIVFWVVITAVDAMGIGQPLNRTVKFVAGVIALLCVIGIFFFFRHG